MKPKSTTELPARDARLTAVNFVADAINRALDLKEIADNALHAVLAVMDLDAGALFTLEENQQALRPFAWRGLSEAIARQAGQIQRGHDVLSDAVLGGRTEVTDDLVVAGDRDSDRGPLRAGFASAILSPIRAQGYVVGILVLGAYQPRDFAGADRELIETICHQIGQALVQTQLQDNLRASEEQYRSMVENSDDAIYLADQDGRPLFANSTFERIFGYTVEELAQLEPFERVHERDAHAVAQALSRLVQGESVRNLEYSFCRKDGEWIDLEANARTVSRDDNAAVRLQFTVHEITETRRRQQELLRRNRQLAALTLLADVANSSLNIEEIARKALEVALQTTGMDAAELHLADVPNQRLELYIQTGLPRDVVDEVRSLPWGESVAGQVAASGQARIVTDLATEDSPVTAAVAHHFRALIIVPLQAKGELLGTLGLASRRRRSVGPQMLEMVQAMGNQLGIALANARLYENLEGKNRLLRLLIEEAHHRIKNNLQMVSGLLQLQAEGAGDGDPAEHLRNANARINAIAQVHNLLSQEMPENVDARRLITTIVETLLVSSGRPLDSPDLRFNVDELWLNSDQAVAVALIVNELVVNAFLHGRPAGREALTVKVSCQRDGDAVRLRVEDNGGGVPGGTDWSQSSGQGMNIIAQLAQVNLRGTLQVDPSGAGVTAEVRFNLAHPGAPAPAAPLHAVGAQRKRSAPDRSR